MKLFDQYLALEDVMSQLRTAAKKVVQKLATLPREQGAELALEYNCRVIIKRITSLNNNLAFIEVAVYLDNKNIGNIYFDFKSEAPYILVAYDLDVQNEYRTSKEIKEKLLIKPFYGLTKEWPVHKPIIS